MLRKLNKLGYEITSGEVQRLAGMGTVGRGHIGQALVKSGYFSKVEYTFEFLLQYGAPAYEDRFRLNLRDAINLLHNAGGIAVWAHPGLLNPDKLERLIHRLPRWAEYGLDGIESDYSQHSLALCDCLRSLALGNGLIYTGGSDFHGELKPNIRLGDGPEGTPIDSVCLESLDERLEMVRDYLKKSSEYRL